MGEKVRGTLILIGGAEDKIGEQLVLREFIEMAGGPRARIGVVLSATESPESVGKTYERAFRKLGANTIDLFDLGDRKSAQSEKAALEIDRCSALFLTGGDQLRISSILGATRALAAILRAYEQNKPIAGTSAGASAVAGTMLIGGAGDSPPKRGGVRIAPGLGLLEEVVVDQHFYSRGRIGRLLEVVAQNPYIIGLGIDEDTAAVIGAEGRLKVVGNNTVTVVDGSTILHSNVSEAEQTEPLSLLGVSVHILASGYGFDLRTRQAFLP